MDINMKLNHVLLVSVLALTGTAAWADDITPSPSPTPSTLSRAEVRAAVLQAREDGRLLGAGELPAMKIPAASSTSGGMTHQAVRALRDRGPSNLIATLYGAP
jgi:hypothetical protein